MRRSLVILLFALGGCGDPTSPMGVLGAWGSESTRLDVTLVGGSFAAPCLEGTLSEPLLPDAMGRFEVAGTLTNVGGAAGSIWTTIDVTFRGSIQGNEMDLIVDRGAGSDEVLALIRHKSPSIPGCP